MSTSTMSSRTGSDPFSETLGAGLTEAGPDDPGGNPAIVRGTRPPTGAGPVLVAVDDDNAGALLRYGCRLAAATVTLRKPAGCCPSFSRSASASMLVVGSSSDRPPSPAALGATTRAILGRTRCPVVVVPYRGLSATRATW